MKIALIIRYVKKKVIMEPLSILSVIIQLATTSPQLDKLLVDKEEKPYTRTETIEIYRQNMSPIHYPRYK
tara:strand:- start:683 stop:892 length:210 start_codon:yes stop_codon:yes gene_type:complete